MKQIKRLINFVLPVTACNFHCYYCYIGQEHRNTGELGMTAYIQKALTRERLGGICHIMPPTWWRISILLCQAAYAVLRVCAGAVSNRTSRLIAIFRKEVFF